LPGTEGVALALRTGARMRPIWAPSRSPLARPPPPRPALTLPRLQTTDLISSPAEGCVRPKAERLHIFFSEIPMTQSVIYRELLPEDRRAEVAARLFGPLEFPFRVEPMVFNMAGMLAADYKGGFWNMYVLSNSGWYMCPATEVRFVVCSPNGFTTEVSADAFGVTACLFAFSHLSFGGDAVAQACADQYHLLREVALGHAEASSVLALID
jgi:hypothetical protein